MNKDLLLRVADEIEAHPEQFDMEEWDCGTTRCIAGWAVRLSEGQLPGMNLPQSAEQYLGLDMETASELFFTDYWPPDVFMQYALFCPDGAEPNPPKAAKIAADYIREFVRGHENSG